MESLTSEEAAEFGKNAELVTMLLSGAEIGNEAFEKTAGKIIIILSEMMPLEQLNKLLILVHKKEREYEDTKQEANTHIIAEESRGCIGQFFPSFAHPQTPPKQIVIPRRPPAYGILKDLIQKAIDEQNAEAFRRIEDAFADYDAAIIRRRAELN